MLFSFCNCCKMYVQTKEQELYNQQMLEQYKLTDIGCSNLNVED